MNNKLLIEILSLHAEILVLRGRSTHGNSCFTSLSYEVETVGEYDDISNEYVVDKYIIRGIDFHCKKQFYAEIAYTGVVIEFNWEY